MATPSQAQVTAQIGGIPTVAVDVPICAVFIALFVTLAAGHMTTLQINMRRHKKKFIFNGMLFGFAMSRIMACVMRIVWATQPSNADVSLVASVFLNAGILLVYVINNLFAMRMLRSAAPQIGWNPALRLFNKLFLWFVVGMIVPLIVIIVLRVKNPTLAGVSTGSTVLSRLAQTYFLLVTLSAPLLLGVAVLKAGPDRDTFGWGRWSTKVIILATAIVLAIIEAGFRCGTAWAPTPLASDPAWWDHKAAFYCFNFLIDVLILGLFLIGRVDRRFWVPNKANGPGSYMSGTAALEESRANGEGKLEESR